MMIGPPGLPKFGRRVFSFTAGRAMARERQEAWKWVLGLYMAGVVAHFSHHMAIELPADVIDPSLGAAIQSAPFSLVWPVDAIETLIDRT